MLVISPKMRLFVAFSMARTWFSLATGASSRALGAVSGSSVDVRRSRRVRALGARLRARLSRAVVGRALEAVRPRGIDQVPAGRDEPVTGRGVGPRRRLDLAGAPALRAEGLQRREETLLALDGAEARADAP